jgi:cell division protein FtsB/cell division protein DivIC
MFIRRLLLALILSCNAILLYNLIWSDKGIFAYLDLKSHQKQLKLKVETLGSRSLDLSQEIRWLKSDRAFTEKMTRAHGNYLRDNEIIYLFPGEIPEGSVGDDIKN